MDHGRMKYSSTVGYTKLFEKLEDVKKMEYKFR